MLYGLKIYPVTLITLVSSVSYDAHMTRAQPAPDPDPKAHALQFVGCMFLSSHFFLDSMVVCHKGAAKAGREVCVKGQPAELSISDIADLLSSRYSCLHAQVDACLRPNCC